MMIAGSALSAMIQVDWSTPPVPTKAPAIAASAPAIAHDIAITPPTETPWTSATSWSSEAARIASPQRLYRKNANRAAVTTMSTRIIAMKRCWTVMPRMSTVDRPQGSPTCRTSRPIATLTTTRMTTSSPSVMIAMTNTGRPIIGRMATRSTPRPTPAMTIAASGTAR
jgi:hypothetical protein